MPASAGTNDLDDAVAEVAGVGVLEDELLTAVRQQLALDDQVAVVDLGRLGDALRLAAAPLEGIDLSRDRDTGRDLDL